MRLKYSASGAFLFLLIVVVLLAVAFGFSPDSTDNQVQPTVSGEGWHISDRQSPRDHNFYHCCGTDDLVYFSYFSENCVDAYDYNGEFQYTIQFQNMTNGGVLMECRDDLLVVRVQDGTTYLFRGMECLKAMEPEEAREEGYWLYINHLSSSFDVKGLSVVRVDGDETVELFRVPYEIEKNLPLFTIEPGNAIVDCGILILFVAAWLGVVGTCVYHICRSRKE